jgi:hypothetical protein
MRNVIRISRSYVRWTIISRQEFRELVRVASPRRPSRGLLTSMRCRHHRSFYLSEALFHSRRAGTKASRTGISQERDMHNLRGVKDRRGYLEMSAVSKKIVTSLSSEPKASTDY